MEQTARLTEKALSAASLFHFTTQMEYLVGILDYGFCPRFCIEDMGGFVPSFYAETEVAQPMVCFCDIPLSSIHKHVAKYGSYGVGLSKEWGERNGVSPVVYVHPQSATAEMMRLIIRKAHFSELRVDSLELSLILSPVHILKNYYKIMRGRMFRAGRYTDEVYNFYDEREWRYVPFRILDNLANEGHSVRVYLTKDEFLSEDMLSYHHQLLRDYCALRFTSDDVRYIFVPTEAEVPVLIDRLAKESNRKNGLQPGESLLRRIFSLERLLPDV